MSEDPLSDGPAWDEGDPGYAVDSGQVDDIPRPGPRAKDSPPDGFVPEVEQQLLGALLSGGDHSRVFAVLKPHNFVEPINGEIFALIVAARDSYNSTTLPTVAKLIPKPLADTFKAQAGITLTAYMAELLSNTIYGAGGSHSGARNVLEQWARVSLGKEASTIAEAARDPQAKPIDLARTASSVFDEVLSDLRTGGRGKTLSSFAVASERALATAREARQKGGLAGISTGLSDFDRATGGLHLNDLVVVAARPSMGKTMVGTSFCRRAAALGIGAAFISLEMDSAKLAARIISDMGHEQGVRVPYQDLINGSVTLDNIEAIEAARNNYNSMPLWIEDQSGLTVSEIRTKAEKVAEEADKAGTPLKLLVVDHAHLVRASTRYAGNRVQEMTEITGGLKATARELGIALVLLAQLSRAVETREDKRPQLSDLRDSGSIEQDADTVVFLYRRAYYLERSKPKDGDAIVQWDEECRAVAHDLELAIAKQRNGPIRTIDLYIDVACSAVRNKAVGYGSTMF